MKNLLGVSIFSFFVFLFACQYERAENIIPNFEEESNTDAILSSQVYSCLQTSNGQLTGQSYEMTLDFLPNGVVHVSRTLRPSREEDKMNLINLSSNPIMQAAEGVEILSSPNLWVIPFRDEPAYQINVNNSIEINCSCEGEGDCSALFRPDKVTCEPDLTCDGCCKMTVTYSAANGGGPLLGGAVVLNGSAVQNE